MAAGPAEHWEADEPLVKRVDDEMQQWRQGDVARPGLSLHIADVGQPLVRNDVIAGEQNAGGGVQAVIEDVDAVAVISQTCDVVRSSSRRPFVKVSPVVSLAGGVRGNAAAGKVPRYAPLPGLGEAAFADLDRCTTIEKTVLARCERERGCLDDNTLKAFGQAVARHHERFAFPNYVDRAFAPLKNVMEKRAGKDSPEGRCVDRLIEIRATVKPEWESDEPVSVELTFIVEAVHLPDVDPEEPVSDHITGFIAEPRKPEDIATELEKPGNSDADRSALWMALADAWTSVVLVDSEPRLASVNGIAESESRYPLSKVNASVRLDLDHLSDS